MTMLRLRVPDGTGLPDPRRRKGLRRGGWAVALAGVVAAAPLPACFPLSGDPGYFVVNSTSDLVDAVPGDGVCATSPRGRTCTLRAAIQESNALPGANSVELPAGTFALTLAEPPDGSIGGGDLDTTDSVQIVGVGSASTIIDADAITSRVLHVQAGYTALANLTVRNGGGIGQAQSGGGLRIEEGAISSLVRVVVTHNSAFSNGGGIMNLGSLVVDESTIDENEVVSRGGGIYNGTSGRLVINNSTISNNESTLGGAMQTFGQLTLNNSTISGNQGSAGTGGIINVGTATLNNVTITQNHAGISATGRAGGLSNYGTLNLRNTIVAGNTIVPGGSPDCAADPINSQGYNVIGDTTGCTLVGVAAGNQLGVDPLLGALAANGGPTRTHALLDGSPAINAGNPAAPGSAGTACQADDQRGVSRLICDTGAYERGGDIIIQPLPERPLPDVAPRILGLKLGNTTERPYVFRPSDLRRLTARLGGLLPGP